MEKVIVWVSLGGRITTVLCDGLRTENGNFVLSNPQVTFDLEGVSWRTTEWVIAPEQVSSYARVQSVDATGTAS